MHFLWQKVSVKELDLEAALAERQVCDVNNFLSFVDAMIELRLSYPGLHG